MNALVHLEAVRALLEAALGYPWSLTFADRTTGQYGVLEGPAWDPGEPSVSGPGQALSVDFRVKAVTGTVVGVGTMLAAVRGLLWTDQRPVRVEVPGWSVEVVYVRSELVDVDQSTTVPNTSRHPAFGVDTYHLTAEPA